MTTRSHIILVYGLTKKQIKVIKSNLPNTKDYEILETNDFFHPILTEEGDCCIINSKKMTNNQIETFGKFYESILFNDRLAFVEEETRLKKKHIFFKNEKDFENRIGYVLLSFFNKQKKAVSFSKQLTNALSVLIIILTNPFISTKRIAEELEINERSVLRYIEALSMAGESIIFDKKRKGWYIIDNKSWLVESVIRRTKRKK